MGFIIFVAVVILAIYLIKKSSSDKNSSFKEPVKSQISFDNLSQEELNDRDEIFRELMQGRNAEELTKCYNKSRSLFIPKEDGRFAGSFSGVLSETYRAKKLKNGKLHYEIKGAYDSFKYGLCMDDDLIRKAEILITICAKYEYGPKYELHKDDVEKYALPSLSR